MIDNTIYLKAKDLFPRLKFLLVDLLKVPLRLKKAISQKVRRFDCVRQALYLPSSNDILFFPDNSFRNDEQWVELESPSEFIHQTPVLSNEVNRWYFEQQSHVVIDPSGLAILNRGYVHGHNGGQYFNANQEYLWDLGRENWRFFDVLYMDSVLRLPKPIKLSGSVAVLAHEYAYSNFAHWTFDVLPKIHILKKAGYFDQVDWFLVGHSGRKYQLQTLLELNVPRHKIINFSKNSHFQADTLLYPRLCGYHQQHNPIWKLDFLQSSFGSRSQNGQTRRLFISRSDASFRRLTGEEQLFELLAPLGFECCSLAGVSLQDTVQLFSEAEAVVGPCGSGLMNIAFCKPGTNVVEIITPAFYNCYHWYLSSVRNLNHAVYFGDDGVLNPKKAPNQLTKNISIDLKHCFNFIDLFVTGRGLA